MDTFLHQRDTVARYLASNTRVGKALSSREQKEWAQRELKYREEWIQNGVWRADMKVDADMIADAWDYTKQESKRAAVRRANAKTVVKKDSEDRMKKREGYASEIEEMDRERNSRDQDREIGARRDTQRTLGGDIVPEQRWNYQSWTESRSPLRTQCDQGEEIPREDQEEHLEKGQSQTFRLGTRANKLPPSAEICHSMTTRSRTLDPQGPTTLDRPLAMGPASDIRTPTQFNTPRGHTIDRLTSLTRSCGPQPYTTEDFMAPLLTDGAGREAYTPWGHQDMTTLANQLPPLTAGSVGLDQEVRNRGQLEMS